MKLSVSHPKLTMVRFEINQEVATFQVSGNEYYVEINQASDVEIFFEPWGVKPLVRLNNHLLDYWLANIQQFDHMIQIYWDKDFYHHYQQRNIDSKISYLKISNQEDIDSYLGINNSNLNLVNEIKNYL